jgi:hypothetical protein
MHRQSGEASAQAAGQEFEGNRIIIDEQKL